MKVNITFHIDHIKDEERMRRVLKGLKIPGVKIERAKTAEIQKNHHRHAEELAYFPPQQHGKRISEADKKKIIKMLKADVPAKKVAEEVGCSEPAVYVIKTKAKREGHTFPPSKQGWNDTNSHLFQGDTGNGQSPELIEQALDDD